MCGWGTGVIDPPNGSWLSLQKAPLTAKVVKQLIVQIYNLDVGRRAWQESFVRVNERQMSRSLSFTDWHSGYISDFLFLFHLKAVHSLRVLH